MTEAAVRDACAGCAKLEDPAIEQVVLLTGQTVCSYCPDWRDECRQRQIEADAVLAMVDKPTRLDHLAKREAEFGSEYRRRLEEVVLDTWKRRRAAVPEEAVDAG